jgi:hypothetical protein
LLSNDDAIRFLNALDPNASAFNFLTNRETDDLKVFKIEEHHGNLDSIGWQLEHRNNSGCGVYVQINESRSESRKKEDIVRVRAIWQEDDNGWEGQLPLPPSLTVQSSEGRYHRYWFGDLSAADFEACMRGLVDNYDSDPNARDVARLLRLPGTVNWKRGGKHLARIVWPKQGEPVRRYTREQLVEAFAKPADKPIAVSRADTADYETPSPESLRSALKVIPSDDREKTWLKVGVAPRVWRCRLRPMG